MQLGQQHYSNGWNAALVLVHGRNPCNWNTAPGIAGSACIIHSDCMQRLIELDRLQQAGADLSCAAQLAVRGDASSCPWYNVGKLMLMQVI